MKHTNLKQFLALQQALAVERQRVQARLAEINRVLGDGHAVTAPASGPRKFSAATKAKMAAAQRARWAKRGAKADSAAATAPKKKRRFSAAGRAAIIAATKARWAKVNAQKAKSGGK